MKILFVLHQFGGAASGGTERVVAQLATALVAAGHAVTIVAGSLERAPCMRVDRETVDGLTVLRLHRDDLHFESWWKAWSPGVSATFARLLDELAPDVVHVHHWLRTTTDFVRQARARGVVTAVTLHDHFAMLASPVRPFRLDVARPPGLPSGLDPEAARAAFEFHRDDLADEVTAADLVYAPSRAHADSVRSLAPRALGEILVLPPPVGALPPPAPRAAGRGRRLVLFGALYEAKGPHVLLQALRLAAERGQVWELEVFGAESTGEYGAHLRTLAAGLPVRFRGAFRFEDLAAASADYAVVPALTHESYGLVVDEACALGLPMLLSDLPAFRERAPAASTAFFAPGDVEALAALLGAPERLAALVHPGPLPGQTAERLAQRLATDYAAAAGAVRPPRVGTITPERRIAMLWARGEAWFAARGPGT